MRAEDDTAAAVDGNGQSDRCGFNYGEVGSTFHAFTMPYLWYGGGGHEFTGSSLGSTGTTYLAEMGNVNTSQPYCQVLTASNTIVFSATLPSAYSEPGTGGRTNKVYSRIGVSSGYPYINSNQGRQHIAYYETGGGAYDLWGEVTLGDNYPYVAVGTTSPYAFCLSQVYTMGNICG